VPLGSNCESDVVDTFTRHSSGSDRWSEVRRLKKRSRRNFSDFSAQGVEHQVARRTKDSTHVSDLKTLALHLQMTNDCNCGVPEFRATIRNDLQRHFIF
jgi:5-formyltetrahydrofolate cyclo-ligase